MAKRIIVKTRPRDNGVDHGPNVPQASIIGPFPGSTTPSRPGIFKRESYNKAGRLLWSYWNGSNWGLMGTNFSRALQRGKAGKKSARQDRPWYGIAAPK
jgi:hypothetical protein